jgi:hypothetical protein
VDFEPMEDFEREVRQAFERRPAPPGLKRKLMERRRSAQRMHPFFNWQKLAAALVLTAILSGSLEWRILEQRRKEEAAREQVMMALRITSHALNQMNEHLAARHRGDQD